MSVSRRLILVSAGVLVGVMGVALGFFLHREGVVLGGAWAGIISLSGIPVGVLGVWVAWPRDPDDQDLPERGPSIRIQQNNTVGHGTTFAVQDGKQIVYNGKSGNDAHGKVKPDPSGDKE